MATEKNEVRYLPNSQVVVISYHDLVKGADLSASIEAAYGFDGLGLITVSDVPNVRELRQQLLPLGKRYASVCHRLDIDALLLFLDRYLSKDRKDIIDLI